MKTVCVYVDEGASFEVLMRELLCELDHSRAQLQPVMAEDILEQNCLERAAAFVMPGGADLPYCAKLNGEGAARLKKFVETGGTYLGICAGAYFGCSSVAFHAGRPDEVSGPRELAFVEATAIGSLDRLGPHYDLTIASASAPVIEWSGTGAFRGYYHGGPRFELSGTTAVVFARYRDLDDAPAGISIQVGAGKAVLVGVHLEMTGATLSQRLAHLERGAPYRHLVALLSDCETPRRRAFRDLLSRAGIPLKQVGEQ